MNTNLLKHFVSFLLFSFCESRFSFEINEHGGSNLNDIELKSKFSNHVKIDPDEQKGWLKTDKILIENDPDTLSDINILLESASSTLTTKCFENLGCVSGDDFVYNSNIKSLPLVFTDPEEIEVSFSLFTRLNRNSPQVFNYKPNDTELINSFFEAYHKTKFIVHGFTDGLNKSDWMTKMKDYFLDHSDYNVIGVDWSKAAATINYFQAAADTRVVGAMVAYFVNGLVNVTNAKESDIHCVGHSLGAHICAFAGQRLQNPKLGQISGLDPAGPGFLLNNNSTRLDSSDADLVVVIHTNAGLFTTEGWIPIELTGILGNPFRLGHFDFWPNGGIVDRLSCNHRRSHDYPVSPPNNDCQYVGYQCGTYLDFQNGKCADCGTHNDKCKPMEFDLQFWDNFTSSERPVETEILKDNYYLKTGDSQPFCIFHYQILVQISKDSKSKVFGRLALTLSNNETVSFPNPIQIPLMSSFEAGTNYTQLYLNGNELEQTNNLLVKWTSVLWAKVKVEKVSINFMSHFDKSVRDQKSIDFCLNTNETISSGSTVIFEKC